MSRRRIILIIVLIILILIFVFLLIRRGNNPLPINGSISTTVTKLEPSKSQNIDSLTNSGNNLTIYIDRKTGLLKSLNPEQTLYQKPVLNFSYRHPYVAIIERENRSSVFLLNLESKTTKPLRIEGENFFISASLNNNNTSVFALGSFNTTDRTSLLYKININTEFADTIERVPHTEVDAIGENNIILFDSGEAENFSNLDYFDVNNKRILYTKKYINSYVVSPDGKKILTKSGGNLFVYNIDNNNEKQFIVGQNSLVYWKDNQTLLILQNTLPGINLGYLNTDGNNSIINYKSIQEMSDKSVANIIGVINNQVVVIDNRYNFYFIDLPQSL